MKEELKEIIIHFYGNETVPYDYIKGGKLILELLFKEEKIWSTGITKDLSCHFYSELCILIREFVTYESHLWNGDLAYYVAFTYNWGAGVMEDVEYSLKI